VVLSDMSLPDGNALDLLEESREGRYLGSGCSSPAAGRARFGARSARRFDFLEKPCGSSGSTWSSPAPGARAHPAGGSGPGLKYSPSSFTGTSAAARSVKCSKLAEVPFSSLVIGRNQDGKGLAARILHHAEDAPKGRWSR
jgi:DNA-binding NtrC family response regulator